MLPFPGEFFLLLYLVFINNMLSLCAPAPNLFDGQLVAQKDILGTSRRDEFGSRLRTLSLLQ